MINHKSIRLADAQTILAEIENDTNPNWFRPKGKPGSHGVVPGDFDLGAMKFINRNLNYFYFINMISHALKNDFEYNPSFPRALDFCNKMRSVLDEPGPFGRMCVWNLDAYCKLLPHVDAWEYHKQIKRYILCVSTHAGDEVLVRIAGEKVDIEQGLLFNFDPSTDVHEFVNYTNRPFYFIGFDYWNVEKLAQSSAKYNITSDTVIPYSEGYYGGHGYTTEFMSPE
jgi:hypothetical protein